MLWFTSMCGPGRAAERARAHPGESIAGNLSYATARDDEVMLRCSNRHCPELPLPGGALEVPVKCHEDLGCYCAPRAMAPSEVARRVGARAACVPGEGACPPGHCARHLGD